MIISRIMDTIKNLKKQLDIVNRGDIIGLVGSTGISSGPHLHFEIWREFKPVDPLLYFPEYSFQANLIAMNKNVKMFKL